MLYSETQCPELNILLFTLVERIELDKKVTDIVIFMVVHLREFKSWYLSEEENITFSRRLWLFSLSPNEQAFFFSNMNKTTPQHTTQSNRTEEEKNIREYRFSSLFVIKTCLRNQNGYPDSFFYS